MLAEEGGQGYARILLEKGPKKRIKTWTEGEEPCSGKGDSLLGERESLSRKEEKVATRPPDPFEFKAGTRIRIEDDEDGERDPNWLSLTTDLFHLVTCLFTGKNTID